MHCSIEVLCRISIQNIQRKNVNIFTNAFLKKLTCPSRKYFWGGIVCHVSNILDHFLDIYSLDGPDI